MKRVLFPVILFIPSILSVGCGGQPKEAKIALQSACEVIVPGGKASGVVIEVGKRRCILTAAHVVVGTKRVEIISRFNGETISRIARVVKSDDKTDLALLLPEFCLGLVPAKLPETKRVELPPGVTCWYCGSGHGMRYHLVKTIVNQTIPGYVYVNGEGWFGHSGSGLYVNGTLVGMVQGGEPMGPKAPVYACDWATIRSFLHTVE